MTDARPAGRPTSILLATDLSCRCDRALDRAAALAREWKVRLVALHVLERSEPLSDAPSWRRGLSPQQAAERRVRADLPDEPDLQIEVRVERGDPASVILQTAADLGCGLIVTGVARDETLGRIWLGSTVDGLATRAQVPVLVVKARPRGPYRSAIVATDFSEGSRRALQVALELVPSAALALFHAYDTPWDGMLGDPMRARAMCEGAAVDRIQEFLAQTPQVAASGREIHVFCEHGDVVSLLQDLIAARGAHLAVIGTEGRTGLASLILGSVAQQLLRALPIDVLIVRRP